MSRGSHRHGATRDLSHRTSARVPVVRWQCDLCSPEANVWNVSYGQTVLDAQAQHRTTHTLELRQGVEALVSGLADGSITATRLRPDDLACSRCLQRWTPRHTCPLGTPGRSLAPVAQRA